MDDLVSLGITIIFLCGSGIIGLIVLGYFILTKPASKVIKKNNVTLEDQKEVK